MEDIHVIDEAHTHPGDPLSGRSLTDKMIHVAVIVGTRPEGVKMAPKVGK